MAEMLSEFYANLAICGAYAIGAAVLLYQMQLRLKKSEALAPGITSSYWLLALVAFSLALSHIANLLLVDVHNNSNFPSIADLFSIIGYFAFLIFLLRSIFAGEGRAWLSTIAAAAILSFQALLLHYIFIIRYDVPMSVILQFLYILLGFSFTIMSIFLSQRHRGTPLSAIFLSLGVFSIAQLGGNWFFSSSVSAGGTALLQSREIGAILMRAASALSIGLAVPFAMWGIEGRISPLKILSSRQFQLAAGVMALSGYLLVSSIYLMTVNPAASPEFNLSLPTEELLKNNMIAAQGTFQIYIIFAILLGYSQASLRRQEFEEKILEMNRQLDHTVAERTAELNIRLAELEKFKRLTIDREIRMVELKKIAKSAAEQCLRPRKGGAKP